MPRYVMAGLLLAIIGMKVVEVLRPSLALAGMIGKYANVVRTGAMRVQVLILMLLGIVLRKMPKRAKVVLAL